MKLNCISIAQVDFGFGILGHVYFSHYVISAIRLPHSFTAFSSASCQKQKQKLPSVLSLSAFITISLDVDENALFSTPHVLSHTLSSRYLENPL